MWFWVVCWQGGHNRQFWGGYPHYSGNNGVTGHEVWAQTSGRAGGGGPPRGPLAMEPPVETGWLTWAPLVDIALCTWPCTGSGELLLSSATWGPVHRSCVFATFPDLVHGPLSAVDSTCLLCPEPTVYTPNRECDHSQGILGSFSWITKTEGDVYQKPFPLMSSWWPFGTMLS